jgi:hypothetical protein
MGLLSGLLWYGAYKRWLEIVPLRGFGRVGFLLLPSVVFWGSGVLRDSLGLPLTLYVAGWLASASRRVSPGDAVSFLVAGIVLAMVRWEGLVLGVVAGIGYHFPWRRWWLWMVAGAVAWLILWVSAEKLCAYRAYWLSPKERPELLEGAHVFRIDCRPGMVGAIWSWMQGVWYGLTGPYLWQVQKGVAFLSALETLVSVGDGGLVCVAAAKAAILAAEGGVSHGGWPPGGGCGGDGDAFLGDGGAAAALWLGALVAKPNGPPRGCGGACG